MDASTDEGLEIQWTWERHLIRQAAKRFLESSEGASMDAKLNTVNGELERERDDLARQLAVFKDDHPRRLTKTYWLENAVLHLLGLLGKDTAGLYLEHTRMADQFAVARLEIEDKGAGVEFMLDDRDCEPVGNSGAYPPAVTGRDLGASFRDE